MSNNIFEDVVNEIPVKESEPVIQGTVFSESDIEDIPTKAEVLNTEFNKTLEVDPDKAAKVYNLAKKTNTPVPIIENNLQEYELKDKYSNIDFDTMFKQNPLLFNYLEDPEKMTLAKDDVDTLKDIEDTGKSSSWGSLAWNSLLAGGGQIGSTLAKAPAAIYNTAALPQNLFYKLIGKPEYQFAMPMDNALSEYYDKNLEGLYSKVPELSKSIIGEIREGNMSDAGKTLLSQFIVNAPNQALLIMGYFSGIPVATLAGMGAMAGTQAMDSALDSGADPTSATLDAILQGGIESGFESLGTFGVLKTWEKALVKEFGKDSAWKIFKDLGKTASYSFMAEGNEEFATQIGQDFADYITGVNKDSLKGTFQRALDAGIIGGFSGLSMSSPSAIGVASYRKSLVKQAEKNKETLLALGEKANNSKLKQRDPEAFQEFLGQAVNDQKIYIPAEALDVYYQQAAPAIVESLGVTEQYNEAKMINGDIEIPLAVWITKMSGEQAFQDLADDIKFMAGDVSKREISEIESEISKEVNSETTPEDKAKEISERDSLYNYFLNKQKEAGKPDNIDDKEWNRVIKENAKIASLVAQRTAKKRGISVDEYIQGVPVLEGNNLNRAIRDITSSGGLNIKELKSYLDDTSIEYLKNKYPKLIQKEKKQTKIATYRDYIKEYGGLKWNALSNEQKEHIKENKLWHLLSKKKNAVSGETMGSGFDQIAEQLVSAGRLIATPNMNIEDQLLHLVLDNAESQVSEDYKTGDTADIEDNRQIRLEDVASELGMKPEVLLSQLLGEEVDNESVNTQDDFVRDENGEILFQKVDKTKNLVALHNIRADGLRNADRMGGLPVPSIAINKVDHKFDHYGDITLIGNTDLVDPKKKGNRVYSADIYSPRYPSVSGVVNIKKIKTLYGDLFNKTKEAYPEVFRNGGSLYTLTNDIENSNIGRDLRGTHIEAMFATSKGKLDLKDRFSDENGKDIPKSETLYGWVRENQQEFDDFKDKMYRDTVEKERIFKGYTYHGNKRWAAHTLENIVKELKKEPRDAEGFNYGLGSLRAVVAKRYTSLREIMANRDKILSEEEFDKVKEITDKEFSEILDEAAEKYERKGENPFGVLDTFTNIVKDGIRSRNLEGELKQYGFGRVDVNRLKAFLDTIKDMPTEYFEAKLKRAVGLNEFSGAVIPNDAPSFVKDILNKQGIPFTEYDRKLENRQEVTTNFIKDLANKKDNILFQNGEPTEAFKKWFGDSKVVDENGKPLVVYHGTPKGGFESFDTYTAGENTANVSDGFYFTENKLNAETYSGEKEIIIPNQKLFNEGEYQPGIYPVYLSLQNPLIIDFEGRNWDGMDTKGEYSGDVLGINDYVNMAKTKGHDGLIAKNISDEGRFGKGYNWGNNTYVVFNPSQIKSIYNSGTFDPDNPNILFQSGELNRAIPKTIDENISLGNEVMFQRWWGNDYNLFLETESKRHGLSVEDYKSIKKYKEGEIIFQDKSKYGSYYAKTMAGKVRVSNHPAGFKGYETDSGYEKGGLLSLKDYVEQKIDNITYYVNDIDMPTDFVFPKSRDALKKFRKIEPKLQEKYGDNWLFFDKSEPIGTDEGVNSKKLFQKQGSPIGAFDPNLNVIKIFGGANHTTIMHEFAHFWLEDEYRYINSGKATEESLRDFEAVKEWLDIKGNEPLTRSQHEKFADGFLTYLGEGKAPNKSLRRTFENFRNWIIKLYKDVSALNVKLNDEVRAYFDKLLVAEEEIEKREKVAGYDPIFRSAEEANMTPEEYQAYIESVELAKSEARNEYLKEIEKLEEYKGTAEYKDRVKEIRAEAEKEVDEQKLYAAINYLRRDVLDGEKADHNSKLSAKILKEEYAVVNAYVGKFVGMVSEEGTHPDIVAELFGYESGEDLVNDILQSPSRQEAIDAIVNARLEDEVAPTEEDAQVAIHNDKRTDVLVKEHEFLEKKLKEKGLSKRTVHSANVRKVAENIINKHTVWEASNPIKYYRQETTAGRQAEFYKNKGDYAKASKAKFKQAVSHVLVRHSLDFRNYTEKALRYLKKFDSTAVIKAIGQEYAEQIHTILENWDLRKSVPYSQAKERKSLMAFQELMKARGIPLEIPENLMNMKQSYKTLTMAEFKELVDTVKAIEHIGRNQGKLIAAQKKRTFEVVKEQILSKLIGDVKVRQNITPSKVDKAIKAAKTFFAEPKKAEFIVDMLDGFEGIEGPIYQAVFQPIVEAENQETLDKKEASKKLTEIFNKHYTKAERKKFRTKRFKVLGHTESFTKENLLAIALNMGNEDNIDRLLAGHKWNEAQLYSALNMLDKKDWDFAQEIWDFFETFWPKDREAWKDVVGIVPPKVKASPIKTKFGVYRGGYYPIKYSKESGVTAFFRSEEDLAKTMIGPQYAKKKVKDSSMKARTGSSGEELDLTLETIPSHLTEVIHRYTHLKAVRDINMILNDFEISHKLAEVGGMENLKQIKSWLNGVITDIYNPQQDSNMFIRGLSKLRTNATIVSMGWKVSTALVQPLGYFSTMELLGVRKTVEGILKFASRPDRWAEKAKFVREKSAFMAARTESVDRDVRDAFKTSFGEKSAIKGSFLMFVGAMDATVTIPSWLEAYDSYISEHKNNLLDTMQEIEKRAIDYADSIVRKSQGSGMAKDLASIQRGNELFKMFTMFYSYFSALYNLGYRRTMMVKQGKAPAHTIISSAMLLWLLPSICEYLLREGLGGDDDDEYLEELLSSVASYPFATLPVIRDFTNAAFSDYSYSITPLQASIESGVNLFKEGKKAFDEDKDVDMAKLLEKGTMAAGYAFGLPTRQVIITVDGFTRWLDEEDIDLRDMFMRKKKD